MHKTIKCPTCSSRNVLPLINIQKSASSKTACICSIAQFVITKYGTKASLVIGKKLGSKAHIAGSIIWVSCRILETVIGLILYAINKHNDRKHTVPKVIDRHQCRKCKTAFYSGEVDR